jgi:hypothetical protein
LRFEWYFTGFSPLKEGETSDGLRHSFSLPVERQEALSRHGQPKLILLIIGK